MVSQVVTPEHRGSFQSFNSSLQQLGTGLASLVSGWVVVEGENHALLRYNWLGAMSIVVLLVSLLMARRIFKGLDS
jgi:MFS transporter, DHA1 family, inner membrane transport protein